MKKYILAVFLLALSLAVFAQAQDWLWAKQTGGIDNDYGRSIALDAAGNCYVAGYFNGTTTIGTTSLTSTGDYDIYVAKSDSNGNWLWAKQAGGTSTDYGYGIAVDTNGNCYVTGFFLGTATFGSSSLTSGGDRDIFTAKLDSNGNWLWAKKAGGTNDDRSFDIAVDAGGNCYTTGFFQVTATFGSTTLTSSGYLDVFVAKLDSNGNWLWAKQAGGTGYDNGRSIALDAGGNCYVTGYFEVTGTFGSTSLSCSGSADVFTAKLDISGNWLWAKKAGGSSSDQGYGISVDTNGNCFVTGYFRGSATFGSTSLTSSGNDEIFIAKLDSSGNWLWACKAGGTGYDDGNDITADNNGNCYVTGYFWGTATFGNTSLTSSSGYGYDVFAVKIGTNGNWLWVKQAGGSGTDYGYGIAVNTNGNCYVTGYFVGSSTFGNTTLTSNGGYDIFTAKLGLPPNPAVLAAPGNGATGLGFAGQTLSWSAGTGNPPDGYKVYFGTDNPPTNLVNGSTQTGTTHATDPLQPDQWHYWKIVPYIGAADASGCPVWSFKTRAELNPGNATDPSPADSAVVYKAAFPCSQTLAWSAPAGPPAPTGYKVFIGSDNPPTDIINGDTEAGTSLQFTVPSAGIWYWKIVPYYDDPGTKSGRDGLPRGDAESPDIWNLITAELPAPVLVSPAANAGNVLLGNTDFVWTAPGWGSFPQGSFFDVYVDPDSGFTLPPVYSGAGAPQPGNPDNYFCIGHLSQYSTKYYWRVRITCQGEARFSETRSLTTIAANVIPPGVPTPIEPPDSVNIGGVTALSPPEYGSNIEFQVKKVSQLSVPFPNQGLDPDNAFVIFLNSPGGIVDLSLQVNDPGVWYICFFMEGEWHQGAPYPLNLIGELPGEVVLPELNFSLKGEIPAIVSEGLNNDPTLPVELSSFTAACTAQNFVSLNWTVQSETNLLGYNILRNETFSLNEAFTLNATPISGGTALGTQVTYQYLDAEVEAGHTYHYWLQSLELSGLDHFFGPVSVTVSGGQEETVPDIPTETALLAAFPNPFSPRVEIPFALKTAADVRIDIYNARGSLVRSFVLRGKAAGYHHVVWDGTDPHGQPLASGVYCYRMTCGRYSAARKVVLLK